MHEDCSDRIAVSRCRVWSDLRDFYGRAGIEAWDKKIPFYATCNPYIANAYANIILTFIAETVERDERMRSQPFYIVELGAGSGTFGFYMLKQLFELKVAMGDPHANFVYVMTDCAGKNVEFWQSHPALQMYIEHDCLDFAVYDVLHDEDFTLINRGGKMSTLAGAACTPMIVLANYLFDSLPHDVFQHVEGSSLREGVIVPQPKLQGLPDNKSLPLDEIDPGFHYRDIISPYYTDPVLDDFLQDYAHAFGDGNFPVPVGALHCLRKLRELSNNRLLLIASDKGFSRHVELFGVTKPDIVLHNDAISMSVNFDALGFYLQRDGGDAWHQPMQQGILTSAFLTHGDFQALPKTTHTLLERLCVAGPGDLFNLYRLIIATQSSCELDILLAGLNTLRWDPQLFNCCIDSILKQLERCAGSVEAQDLAENLPLVSANFYYLPNATDTLLNIALIMQELKFYRPALCYYESSLEYFGRQAHTLYNMGLCHYFLQEYEQATGCFKESLKLDSDYIMARGWLAKIEEELASRRSHGGHAAAAAGTSSHEIV